jgi:hypothetical protein
MPAGFEHVPPGVRLSVLLSAMKGYETAEDVGSVRVNIDEGPFHMAPFFHRTQEHDPEVDRITFYVRPGEVEALRADAIKAFGSHDAVTSVSGRELRWADVNGYSVEVKGQWLTLARPRA